MPRILLQDRGASLTRTWAMVAVVVDYQLAVDVEPRAIIGCCFEAVLTAAGGLEYATPAHDIAVILSECFNLLLELRVVGVPYVLCMGLMRNIWLELPPHLEKWASIRLQITTRIVIDLQIRS